MRTPELREVAAGLCRERPGFASRFRRQLHLFICTYAYFFKSICLQVGADSTIMMFSPFPLGLP